MRNLGIFGALPFPSPGLFWIITFSRCVRFGRDKNRWKADGESFPTVLVASKTDTTRESYEPKQLVCYTVLYCIVLYCIVLYCVILYYIILYYIVLYYTVLYYIVLCYTILYCIILYCIEIPYPQIWLYTHHSNNLRYFFCNDTYRHAQVRLLYCVFESLLHRFHPHS